MKTAEVSTGALGTQTEQRKLDVRFWGIITAVLLKIFRSVAITRPATSDPQNTSLFIFNKYKYIHQTKHVMDPTGFRRGVNEIFALLGRYAA